MTKHTQVLAEIEALRAQGETDIVVSMSTLNHPDGGGQEMWGELCALPREVMDREMAAAYGDPEWNAEDAGMMTAEQFEYHVSE